MKIAVISGRGLEAFGGIETYILETYRRIARDGHEVIIYSRKDGLSPDKSPNIKICLLPCLHVRHLNVFSHCIFSVFAAWTQKIDIVCYHGSVASLVSFLPVRRGVKKIVVFHGLDRLSPILNNLLKSGMRISEIIGSRFSDKLIVTSEYLKNYFYANYLVHSDCVLPGSDKHETMPPKEISKLGLEKDGYILFLGRLAPEKGCHLLIEAYKSINTKTKLVIAGPTVFDFNDSYYRYLRKLSAADRRIIFTGAVEKELKEELLSNAYFMVYPSSIGGLPLVILEAMSHGKCVLVSSICDYYRVIKRHSVLFDIGNKMDFLAKLELLLEDPERCERCGRAAQEYVLANFSWEDTALKFESIFDEVKNNGCQKTSYGQRN